MSVWITLVLRLKKIKHSNMFLTTEYIIRMNKHWQKAFDQTTKKKNYFTFSTQNILILQCNWDISFFLQNEQLFLSPIKSKKRLIIYLLRIYLNFKKLKDILSYLLTFELIPLIWLHRKKLNWALQQFIKIDVFYIEIKESKNEF